MTKDIDAGIINFIRQNHIRNSTGEEFEWVEHKFLLDPLCDIHPRQGINKSAQVGWSESVGIIKALYLAKIKGMNGIYTLPTDMFLQRFVTPKVDPIIEYNPVFNDITGGVQLKTIPSILKGSDGKALNRYIYFMGTYNSKAKGQEQETSKGVSVTADFKIHDEHSRSDQFVISQMISRLENSKFQYDWSFDNPTYPNMGADYKFQRSDQRYWFVKCPHCGWRQYLDWVRLDKHDFKKGSYHCYVDTAKNQFICGKCRGEIYPEDRMDGEWIAKNSNITDYRGYWLSQLCYIRHDVASILRKEEDPKVPKSQFYNFVLGKPYIGSDVKVTRSDIMKLLDGEVNRLEGNAMGIDQGKVKWYVIGNEQGIFEVGHTESWEDIEKLIKKYNVKFVTDALPYQAEPKALTEKYQGDGWRAFYKPESDQSELARFSPKNDTSVVLIRRNEMFDMIVDEIIGGKMRIQVPLFELEDFIRHWESLVRVVEEDRDMNQRFEWVRTDDDHLAHATLYFKVALMKAQGGKIKVLRMGQKEKLNPGDPDYTQKLIDSFTKNHK